MGTLYTVNFKRKKFVTRYDMKGRVVEQKEEWIDETIRDLPLATAQHYVDKTGAMIVAQYEDRGLDKKPLHRGRVKFDYQKEDAGERPVKAVPKRAAAPAHETISKPADYADLVNALMENEG